MTAKTKTPKDPTGAERQRRYKERQKLKQQQAIAGGHGPLPAVTKPVTPVISDTPIVPTEMPVTSVTVTPRIEVIPPRPRRWSAIGRITVGSAIIAVGGWIVLTSIRANSWFGHSLTPDPTAADIYASLSVAAEILACLLPTGILFYRRCGEVWTAIQGWAFLAVTLAVVFLAAGGFAITNLNAGVEARAERQTTETSLAQRRLDTITKSRLAECARRGDRCRKMEAEEQDAIAALGNAQASVRAEADPQAAALGISSTNLHLVQAGSMVALCLFSGLFISFGAGLIWPKN